MVTVKFKDELKDLLTDKGPRIISDDNLTRSVRQLVVHINVSLSRFYIYIKLYNGIRSLSKRVRESLDVK